ncbi:hypothetical protein FB451DRAFT_1413130 [Mycena latifolia]|nr:hypothetical protein FB451DRAFT_1413130 [Mycena latifolia]
MLEKAPTRPDGPKSRRRRAPSRCALILIAIGTLVLLVFGKRLFSFLRFLKTTPLYDFPPRDLFVEETDINRAVDRSEVVQPLVGLNDSFDVAVTVWQLATFDEQMEQYRLLQHKQTTHEVLPDFATGASAGGNMTDEAAKLHSAYVSWYENISFLEKTIFSDIVFRGVRLSDTDVHANVTLQIPTEVFHNLPGTNYDLRASFVILPHSPSLLEYLKTSLLGFPPPFPLTSPTEYHRRVIDPVLDSFAITIPLLEQHEVPSICPPQETEVVGDLDYEDYYQDQADDVLLKHPHVVTRTHLRVVRESRLFRRDAFLRRHDDLRNTSCRQQPPDGREPHLNFCCKSYLRNGNWETMVQLAVPDPEADGGFREESAYAPYMMS